MCFSVSSQTSMIHWPGMCDPLPSPCGLLRWCQKTLDLQGKKNKTIHCRGIPSRGQGGEVGRKETCFSCAAAPWRPPAELLSSRHRLLWTYLAQTVRPVDGGGGAGIVATKSNDPENHWRQDFQLQLRVGGGVQGIKGQKKGAETKITRPLIFH